MLKISKPAFPQIADRNTSTAASPVLSSNAPRKIAFAVSLAALTMACSNGGGNTPSRGVSSGGGLNRPAFTEEEYGVSTSPRVAGSGSIRKGGGSFKLGSPYKVAGRWYVPREEPGYDRAGVASWYGDDFHGRRTANGEIFDKSGLTAAHPTLPLPSYAYVTNIDTGRTILVRVNDRGPYVSDRLIDLSRASARALGYENQGRARVRVRYAGRAPLNGDDRRERQYLAEQRWNNGRDIPAVAAYRPPQAPIVGPQPFPEGTPGRWSPTAYRAALAGKPTPAAVRPVSGASVAEPYDRGGRYEPTGYAPQPQSLPYTTPPAALAGPARVNSLDNSGSGRAFVHIGVFRERANAERLRRDLATLGPVEVAPVPAAQGGELYRVRIGPMSGPTANDTVRTVAARGITGSAVIFE